MSEYLIQGDTLTGIADAIREKLGSSDGIDPAQMAEMIKGIQSGGGDGAKTAYGSITVAADTSIHSTGGRITHNLGAIPKGLCFVSDDQKSAKAYILRAQLLSSVAFFSIGSAYSDGSNVKLTVGTSSGYLSMLNAADATEEEINLFFSHGYRSGGTVYSGTTLHWVAWG